MRPASCLEELLEAYLAEKPVRLIHHRQAIGSLLHEPGQGASQVGFRGEDALRGPGSNLL
jgi:hypothetical protein